MSQFKTQITKLKERGRVILMGDFNAKIEIDKPQCQQRTSRNEKYLEEILKDTDMVPISTKAQRGTWTWTRKAGNQAEQKSVIDYILVDK